MEYLFVVKIETDSIVTIVPEDADSINEMYYSNILPNVDTIDGSLTIYSDKIPTENINITIFIQ